MYIVITQCFASKVGGIESLMTNLALAIAKTNEVKVFADQHFYVQDAIFDSDNESIIKIFRYGGIKYFRRRKKARDIKLYIENKDIKGVIADTWKSLELCIKEIKNKNIPVICLAHGNELLYNEKYRKDRITNTLSKVDKIVANSKFTSKLIEKLGLNKNNICVINPGAKDLRSLKIKNNYEFQGDPILLTLARLDKRKGHQEVLYSLDKLKSDFPNVKYIVAGEGPEKKELIKLVNKLSLQNHVYFVGNINDFQKKEIFEISTLMVMPTLDESLKQSIEGFGISYIEAAMFGIPSVATDTGGVSDAIIDEETGILLNSNKNLHVCLKKLLSNKPKLNILGQKAKERALGEFTWDNVIKKYLNIF